MRIVVTGGAGDLGSRVVRELRGRAHEAVTASRRSGVDLSTGVGLASVLDEADAVVHCASNPAKAKAVDVTGTRTLVEAVRASARPPHLVYISIVGCDHNPYRYYRAKAAAEHVIDAAGVPATIVRATQFHALAAFMARLGSVGPVALTIGDMAIQPVDIDWVASRLTDVAVGPVPTTTHRAADLAGPDLLTSAEISRLVATHNGTSPPRVLRLPPIGGTMRAFSDRANVPTGDPETGGRSFADWLAKQPTPLPRAMRHRREPPRETGRSR